MSEKATGFFGFHTKSSKCYYFQKNHTSMSFIQGLLKNPIKTEAVLRYGAPPPRFFSGGQAAP